MKKLKLNLLTLCDFANVSQEGKLSVIGMFDRIFTKAVPSSFVRLFVVVILEGESNIEHTVELNIQDPKGGKILPTKVLKIKLGSSGKTNIITDVVNMPLSEFGEYKLSLESEDKKLGSTIFWVNRAKSKDEEKNNKFVN